MVQQKLKGTEYAEHVKSKVSSKLKLTTKLGFLSYPTVKVRHQGADAYTTVITDCR